MASTCLATHRDGRDRLALPGLRLCQGCRHRLTRHLAELPALHDACGLALAGTGAAHRGDPVTHRRDPGLNLSQAAVAAREHIRVELVSWCRIALEEGPWDVAPPDRVPVMAGWLVARVEWLAAREYADEIARTIADTHAEARAAAYPSGTRRIVLGPCVEGGCAGTMSAIMHADADLLPGVIRCDADEPHEWAAHEWIALGRRINAQGHADLVRVIAG